MRTLLDGLALVPLACRQGHVILVVKTSKNKTNTKQNCDVEQESKESFILRAARDGRRDFAHRTRGRWTDIAVRRKATAYPTLVTVFTACVSMLFIRGVVMPFLKAACRATTLCTRHTR